jgi:hypothetical protein
LKENNDKIKEERMVQRVIDPVTGKDITGEYVREKLKELEIIGNKIIKSALYEYHKSPELKKEIYEKSYDELHQKLGMGSIGPATAAAGPLLNAKKEELASLLEIEQNDLF